MGKPKCNTECRLEKLKEQDICCYWCVQKIQCENPCKNLDCKAVKEIEFEDNE